MEIIKKKFKKTGAKMLLAILLSIVLTDGSFIAFATENTELGAEDIEIVIEETVQKNTDNLSAPENVNKKGYDVVYVVDNSRSVWGQQTARNHALRTISSMAVWSDIRIGGVFFADHVYDTLSLTSVKDNDGAQQVLDFLDMTEQDKENIDTNIGTALEAAMQLFDSQDSSRERIVILFSDGINENLDGEKSYAQSADQKTKQQVALLKEKNIPIYCVFLQKDRNDEAYLKQLVNYFSEEENYAEKRFFNVPVEKIATLSDTFVDVFHSMQNDMKYRQVKLDSNGTMKFYVPSLGINQLKIYLEGNLKDGGIHPLEIKENESLVVGSALYVLYENPKVGEWAIEVPSQTVNGTITYYADLLVDAELEKVENDRDEKQYQLVASFYDEAGNEISIDPMVSMEAKILFVPEGETEEQQIELHMQVEDGKGKSEPIVMDSYGSYNFELHVEYEDFVNLDYAMEGGEITRQAPVVYNKFEEKFLSEKSESGYVYSMKESELFEDLEDDAVIIEKTVQLIEGNPVMFEQKDGYIKMTAQNKGDIHCVLKLRDDSGMSAEVTVQGTVKDAKIMSVMNILAKAAFVLAVILLILLFLNGMKKKRELANLIKEFERLEAQLTQKFNGFAVNNQDIAEAEAIFDLLFAGNRENDFTGLYELAEGMSEELQAVYGIKDYLEEGFVEKNMEPLNETTKAVEKLKSDKEALNDKVSDLKDSKESTNKKIKAMQGIITSAEKQKVRLAGYALALREQLAKVDELQNEINQVVIAKEELENEEMHYDLSVTEIDGLPGKRGKMKCKPMNTSYRKGAYKLDDLSLLGRDTIGKLLGNTAMYVFAYKSETGEEGLELKGANKFTVYDAEGAEVSSEGNGVALLKGMRYTLKLANGKKMKLEVSK